MFPLTRLLIAAMLFAIIWVTTVIPSVGQSLISNIGSELVLALQGLTILVLLGMVIERRSPAEMGLGRRGLLRHTFLGFGIATAMLLLMIVVLKLGASLGVIVIDASPNYGASSDIYWHQLGAFGYPAAALVLTFLVAVAEEIFFRGILFRLLEEALGSWLALAISSLLFGMVHIINYGGDINLISKLIGVTPQMAIGLPLAAAYILTRKLWLPMGIHWGWDFLSRTYLQPPADGGLLWLLLVGFSFILAGVLLALAVRQGQYTAALAGCKARSLCTSSPTSLRKLLYKN